MRLVIQSNLSGRQVVWVVDQQGKIIAFRQRLTVHHSSEKLLALVDRCLGSQKLPVFKLTSVLVVRGPGTFTAVRTGLIVANTLGWLLRIPVQGIVSSDLLARYPDRFTMPISKSRNGKIIRPAYGREPNIFSPKPV
jgi:tRNA A37 threonylcarbamoyladenosine modification protein TsaB